MNIGKKIAEEREYRNIEKSLESYFAEVARGTEGDRPR
jgi:hypothetical protein